MTIEKLPKQKSDHTFFIYTALAVVLASLLVFVVWALRDLILPCTLGVLLAYLFRPLIRSHAISFLPYKFRVCSALVAMSLGFLILFFAVQASLPDDRGNLELKVRLQYKLNERYAKFMGLKSGSSEGNFLHSLFGRELEPLKNSLNRILTLDKEESSRFLSFSKSKTDLSAKYLKYFSANQIKNETRELASVDITTKQESTLMTALHLASIWLLMPIIFLFLLFDDRHILRYFVSLAPNRYFELMLTTIYEVDSAIGNYLRGTLIECLLVSITFTLGFFLIGIPLKVALLIGIFAGLTNVIPFVGPMIGLGVGFLYALIAEDLTPVIPGLMPDQIFIGVALVVAVTHFLDSFFYAPVILGGTVNLHPLMVILGVMGGAIIFGFAGMLLAIPTIVVTKVMTETLFRGLKAYHII